jgi:hypothetical protein
MVASRFSIVLLKPQRLFRLRQRGSNYLFVGAGGFAASTNKICAFFPGFAQAARAVWPAAAWKLLSFSVVLAAKPPEQPK